MSNSSSRICLHFISPGTVHWQALEAGEGPGREKERRQVLLAVKNDPSERQFWVLEHVKSLSCVWLSVTLRTVAHQVPLSVGFFRQEHWSGLPCPPPEDPLNPGTEPTPLIKSPAREGGFFTDSTTWGVFLDYVCMLNPFRCVWLCVTLWTVTLQAPLSTGFSRQEYCSGLPCPPPGDPAPNVMLTILFSPK